MKRFFTCLAALVLFCAATPVFAQETLPKGSPPGKDREEITDIEPDGPGNLMVRISWESGADVDLWVTEPGGEKCWFKKTSTSNGGTLSKDVRNGPGDEIYEIQSGPGGSYRIDVNLYDRGGDEGPTRVVVEVIQHYGTPMERSRSHVIDLNRKGETRTVTTVSF